MLSMSLLSPYHFFTSSCCGFIDFIIEVDDICCQLSGSVTTFTPITNANMDRP